LPAKGFRSFENGKKNTRTKVSTPKAQYYFIVTTGSAMGVEKQEKRFNRAGPGFC
jgi:hypothetical protein